MKKHLLIIATLDTKGREAAYIKGDVQRLGIQPTIDGCWNPRRTFDSS